MDHDAIAASIRDRFRTMPVGAVPPIRPDAQAPIDYDVRPTAAGILPLPDDIEDLQELVELAEKYAAVVERGASLAVWTDFQGTSAKTDSPWDLALASMTPDERQWFEYWRGGEKRVPLEWDKVRADGRGEKDRSETIQKRVQAMQMAWGEPRLNASNWHGLRKMAPELIPIVTAYDKYIAAHNGIKGGTKVLSALEMQEYQTITKIRATVDEKIQKKLAEINRLTRRYDVCKKTLQAREHPLKDKLVKRETPREDLINKARRLRGQATIDASMNKSDVPRGQKRRPRREVDEEELDRLAAGRIKEPKRARTDQAEEEQRMGEE
uniref:Uncharacterized protein n=1 Tax=Rhizoctonia solani bipartite-like virus 1 TaxID=2599895 RepID=A0A5B8GQ19_9VIRU|nr:hypothetical protein [Rhizoctonia solani bipartite-like virus 1]